MTIKNYLIPFALVLELTVYNGYSSDFSGKIAEEQIRVYKMPVDGGLSTILEVIKPDGTKIEYFDSDSDFKPEYVKITPNGKKPFYHTNSGRAGSRKINTEFNNYLKKVK